MKFIETIDQADRKKAVDKTYNRVGEETENSKDKAFAKESLIPLATGGMQQKWFITTHNNVPYDPHGIDSHRESKLTTRLKSVSKTTFDYYILYLKTRNLLYMTRTQRSFING